MSTQDATAGESSSMTPNYRMYTMMVLLLAYTSSYVDRQIMGILIEPIKADLLLSDTQMGFMSGIAFAIFYATLGIPIAFLADRWSRRNIISVSILIWSGMTMACGTAGNFVQLAIARVGVGIGEAGSSPPSHSMIADMYAPQHRAGAMAVYALGVYLGIMLGFLVGAYVAAQYGWRMAFYVVGAPGLLIALLVRFTLREPKRGESEGLPEKELPPFVLKDAIAQVLGAFKHLATDKVSFHTVAGVTLVSFVGYGGAVWGASFLIRSHGFSLIEVGEFLALVIGVGGVTGALVGGFLTDKVGQIDPRWRSWIVTAAKVAAAPLVLFTYLTSNTELMMLVYIPVTILGAFYLGPSFAMIQSRAPIHMRSLVSAVMLFILNMIGLGLGPQMVGILSDYLAPSYGADSLRYALMILSFFSLWGALHYYLAGRAIGAELKEQEGR
ncbi:MAG: MFS transporter [Parvibaculaceae bacterium]|nr:MFS transporter [Parvibaculaceae bacterium]